MVVGWQFLRTSARTVRLGHMYLDTIVWWVFEIRTYGSHGGDWEWAIIYLFVRISKQPRNFRYPKARKLSESSSRKNFCIFEFRLSNSNSRIFRNDLNCPIVTICYDVTVCVTQEILYHYQIYYEMRAFHFLNVIVITLYSKIKGLMDVLISFFHLITGSCGAGTKFESKILM